ncbi:MAG TPA: hypothetical protein VME42_12665 [Steroidobacteraceae bacterium]|nr:hypothetical protein [Steroidobacteraceae bacterium]
MNARDQAARDAILARLAESRTEIRRLLEPRPEDADTPAGAGSAQADGDFPRSRTMRMLLSGRGLGALGATAAGLLIARPGLVWRFIRMLPAGAVMRLLVARLAASLRERDASRR